MNLYLISQNVNNEYDTYSSAVVTAPDLSSARNMHPRGFPDWIEEEIFHEWAKPEHVKVELIGRSIIAESRVICASFHAG